MKKTDVPQDDANMMQGKFREPVYVLDDNGNYTTVRSVGWDPKNEVMQDAWDNINEKVKLAREKVLAGKVSPIAYYIEKNIMDVRLVASYMGIWRWKVKRHMKPSVFRKLDYNILEKYAEVFGVTVEQLMDIELIENGDKEK
jgi:hypothetical protein